MNALVDAHREDPKFGYLFLANEARKAGWWMCRRTAFRLCSEAGITSAAQRRRRSKNKKQGPAVFEDFVQYVFAADAPNRGDPVLDQLTDERVDHSGEPLV